MDNPTHTASAPQGSAAPEDTKAPQGPSGALEAPWSARASQAAPEDATRTAGPQDEAATDEADAAIAKEARYDSGHAWRTQPAFDELRPTLAEVPTPSLDEMAKAPGATQTLYKVVYERVGRRGGRDGSPPPPPFNVWAIDADSLAEHIHKDARRYLTSRETEVVVDLETLRGCIFAGLNNGGGFRLEVLATTEGGAA